MAMRKRREVHAKVPDDSCSDIAFLLLIFFMVSTVFKTETGVKTIKLPTATKFERLPKRKVVHIWVEKTGRTVIDDVITPVDAIAGIMAQKKNEIPGMLVAFNTDKDAQYGIVMDVINQLKIAETPRISFNVKSNNPQTMPSNM